MTTRKAPPSTEVTSVPDHTDPKGPADHGQTQMTALPASELNRTAIHGLDPSLSTSTLINHAAYTDESDFPTSEAPAPDLQPPPRAHPAHREPVHREPVQREPARKPHPVTEEVVTDPPASPSSTLVFKAKEGPRHSSALTAPAAPRLAPPPRHARPHHSQAEERAEAEEQAEAQSGWKAAFAPLLEKVGLDANDSRVWKGAAAFGAAVLLLGVWSLRTPSSPLRPGRAGKLPSGASQDPSMRASKLATDGHLAYVEHRYGDAVDMFEAALQLAPGEATAAQGLPRARAAAQAERDLKSAQQSREDKRYIEARATLAAIPADSDLSPQVHAEQALLDETQGRVLLAQGEAAIADGKPAEAKAALVLLRPVRADYAAQLEQALGGKKPAGGGDTPRQPRPAATDKLASAMALFDQDPGQGASALEALAATEKGAEAAKLTALAAQARDCESSLHRAESDSPDMLDRAIKDCVKVSPSGAVTMGLRGRVVKLALKDGQAAEDADDPVRAAKAFRRAIASKPDDPSARKGVERALDRARELYMKGYVAAPTDPDAAAKQFKEALEILAPGDADYDRAKAKLAEVRSGGQ